MDKNAFLIKMIRRYTKQLSECYEKSVPVVGHINSYLSKRLITASSTKILPQSYTELFRDDDLANFISRSSYLANINEKVEFLLLKNPKNFKFYGSPILKQAVTNLRIVLMKLDIIFRYFSAFQKKIAKLYNQNTKITERLEITNYLFTTEFHANITESLGIIKSYLAFHDALAPLPLLGYLEYEGKNFLNKKQLSLLKP